MQDARLDIHVHGFWKPGDQPFLMSEFTTRMLNPIETSSYSVYMRMRKSDNNQVEKLNIEHGTFTPLIFKLVDTRSVETGFLRGLQYGSVSLTQV